MDPIAEIARDMTTYSDMLLSAGLLHLKGGNYSVRLGDDMIVTRTRSFKNDLVPERLVRAPIYSDKPVANASSVTSMHRAIYRRTDAKAIIHAHPYHPALLSFFVDEFSPIDENGLIYLGRKISVVGAPEYMVWHVADEAMAEALVDSKAAILKWHGTFTKGETLADAFHATQGIETAARFFLDVWRLRGNIGKEQLAGYVEAPFWT
jgi:L-fuculose-phosphate aldolase